MMIYIKSYLITSGFWHPAIHNSDAILQYRFTYCKKEKEKNVIKYLKEVGSIETDI